MFWAENSQIYCCHDIACYRAQLNLVGIYHRYGFIYLRRQLVQLKGSALMRPCRGHASNNMVVCDPLIEPIAAGLTGHSVETQCV